MKKITGRKDLSVLPYRTVSFARGVAALDDLDNLQKTLWTIHFVADQLIQIICNIIQDWRLCKRPATLDDTDHLQKHCHYRLCSKLSFLNYPDYLQHIYTGPAKGRPLWTGVYILPKN